MLKINPYLNTIQFWKNKCQRMYPEKTYLDNFAGLENFLMKSRAFTLTIDDNNINSCLFGCHPLLEKQILTISSLIKRPYLELIKANISKCFIVIKKCENGKLTDFFQADIKNECNEKSKKILSEKPIILILSTIGMLVLSVTKICKKMIL